MAKPKILFVIGKWSNFDPRQGASNARHNYVESLRATGLAEIDCFYVDEHLMRHGTPYDEALIRHCRANPPDVLYVSLTRGVDFHGAPETFQAIGQAHATKLVAVFNDCYAAADAARCAEYAPVLDLVLLGDSYTAVLGQVAGLAGADKYLPVWTPQDPAHFYPADQPPGLDISFLGSVARYPERKLGVGLLGAGFDNFIHRGGQAEDPLSQEDYGNILRASKITVNFSRPVFDEEGFQCKGRVIEALSCGTLLLEQKNPETERWLIPGRDYADFADEREMIDKAKYYLAHEEERASIADAGHQKVRRLYSGAAYWRLILDALQVKPGGAS